MTSTHPCRIFSLAEILSATKNFDGELVIGKGGVGKVYKGQIANEEAGHVVAVKRLDSTSDQGELEFRAEINMLSTLRHCNLVSLIGYCHEYKEMILVYEYMPNGTLYHHLHKADTPLSWVTWLKIAIGAARGLDYLHTGVGTQHGVIHRDVKSSNILIDKNWAAMISDFGLSKIGPTNQSISFVDASVKGTFGYLDPEYFYTRKLTRKTDVYAFGVVLFELLSGRHAVDERNGEDQCSLVRWAKRCVREKKLDQMVDSGIKGTIPTKCLRRFTQIAYCCVHSVPIDRPTMTEVVASLQVVLKLQDKSKDSAESSGIMGFPWKMHKYFTLNSDQSGTSTTKGLDNMNHHEESVINGIKKFQYDELKYATRNFKKDTCMHEGAYVTVYKGWLQNAELPVLIKKLHYKLMQFDLSMLAKFRHPNIVNLIGYSLKSGCHILVYEFMNNGNFDDLLHSGSLAPLPLVTKVKILVGIGRAIVFLQQRQFNNRRLNLREAVLDRRRILLDEENTAKLSDYDCGRNNIASSKSNGDLVLKCKLAGYKVIFLEVLTGERIYSYERANKIDRLFRQCGKESLSHMAELCFKICNEVDSESKMLTMLKEHDELIQGILESWLDDSQN